MAVEARHLSLFPPQILDNREFVVNGIGNGNGFGAPIGHLAAGNSSATEMYGSGITGGFQMKTTAIKTDSGLTYTAVLRKRPRESTNTFVSVPNHIAMNRCADGGSFTFVGEDISGQIQQQQLEIDRFIAQHTETVRIEIDERRKQYSRRVAAAVEETVLKKLMAKEEEIQKIGKLNFALEERVRSLCVENQIWRDLAQSNETAANNLRCNLEQVLARVEDEKQRRNHDGNEAETTDDAESCCGSNAGVDDCGATSRMCRGCGGEESCVLLLPCRHLCLCTVCSSAVHQCPICKSTKTASLHINLSVS